MISRTANQFISGKLERRGMPRGESPVRVSSEKLGINVVKTFNSEISEEKAKYLNKIRNSQADFIDFENFISELLIDIYHKSEPRQQRKLCTNSIHNNLVYLYEFDLCLNPYIYIYIINIE